MPQNKRGCIACSELHKVLFFELSVTVFLSEISQEPLNGFVPNSHGRRVWSLAWTSWRSRSPRTKKRHCPALSAACARFMIGKTSLASGLFWIWCNYLATCIFKRKQKNLKGPKICNVIGITTTMAGALAGYQQLANCSILSLLMQLTRCWCWSAMSSKLLSNKCENSLNYNNYYHCFMATTQHRLQYRHLS